MPIVEVLDNTLIDKIAAGEVIERPASVVKELVENSLDAGSAEIKIDILNGGKHLIRVVDNGMGMEPEDALNSIKRHATSKIRSESDLSALKTLGFRGEALSSIASVSRMSITTAKAGTTLATTVEIHGGTVKNVSERAGVGTIIEVRELFYNTPARKKFLKSTQNELFYVLDVITQAALSYINVKFTVNVDERESMNLPGASGIDERIQQLFGTEFLDGLQYFNKDSHEVSIQGFASKEGVYRRSRSHQYMFVNHRPIKDNVLRYAVYQAYKTLLKDKSHPIFFLYVDMNPAEVDFNVHPTKKEVRFADRDSIYRTIMSCIAKSIIKSTQPDPAQTVPVEMPRDVFNIAKQKDVVDPFSKNIDKPYPDNFAAPTVHNSVPLAMPYARDYIYLGDVYAAYAHRDGLCIIDHHAAHERVLYEKFKDMHGLISGRLLFPYNVSVSAKEYSLLCGNIRLLNDMGIEIEDFGKDMFIIRSLPAELLSADIQGILSDIASSLIEVTADSPIDAIKDIIAKRIACHSSVRGKAVLSDRELSRLIDDLNAAKDPQHCPHGRPTRIYICTGDLQKMFKRT